MKSRLDFLLLFVVASIGFVLPWWSLFIFCFIWSYFKLGRPTKIMLAVFVVHFIIIVCTGRNFIMALNFPEPAIRAIIVPMIAFLFGGTCYLIASSAQEIRKLITGEA